MKRFFSAVGPAHPLASHGRTISRLTALAALLVLAVAIFAPAGQASETENIGARLQKAARQAVNAAEKASREALKAAEKESLAQKRAASRASREARHTEQDARNLGPKYKDNSVITIGCNSVTVAYQGFNAIVGRSNHVQEWVTIQGGPYAVTNEPFEFKPIVVSFEGSQDVDVQPIAFPVGHYAIVVHTKWDTNGAKGGFQAVSHVVCGPAPAYTISTLQSIAGSAKAPTSETLGAKVGDVVDYVATVRNTGNTPLTFSDFADPHCDPATIVGGSLTPVEPSETLTFDCSHTLSSADEAAGSFEDRASVSGAPEVGEGEPVTLESNTVTVTPIGAAASAKTTEEEDKGAGTTSVSSGATSGVSGATTAKAGVLTFRAASVPALKGPEGCARSTFTVSVRAAGVSTVVFYLDGHKLARKTFRNAHKGLIAIRINPAKLKVGAHRVTAAITMKMISGEAKAAHAMRRMTIVRCKPAAVKPHFTG